MSLIHKLIAIFFFTLVCTTSSWAVEKLVINGLFKDQAIVTIDGKQRILRAGQTSPEGVTLVSADSKQAVLEINGQRVTRGLGSHIGSTYAAPAQKPPVRIWPTSQGMYKIAGSINGYPVDFLVDTGATYIAMNSGEARRLGIDYVVEGELGMSSTASGVVSTYHILLDKVKVGHIDLTNVEAAVIDGNFPTEVLLGNSFLNRLDMIRDGQVMELRRKF